MPNGKPGDHPYTDIVVHRLNVYRDDIDDLVRELSGMGSESLIDEVADLLQRFEPYFDKRCDINALHRKLLELKGKYRFTI